MDAITVKQVQSTWALVAPLQEEATLLFYGKLFEQNPDVKVLFKGGPDMLRVQAKRLFKMLDTAVAGLSGDLNELVTVLKDLGRRHVGYGVVEAHYAVVGGALLATLEAALSPSGKWTPEAKGAWTAVYGVIASTMKDGAKLDPEWAANEASWEARKAAAKAAAAGSYFDGINWTTVAASVAAIAVVGVTVMARFRDSRT